MTDKKSKRVVIIDNIKSETIEQAIFILKSDTGPTAAEGSVSREAQNIINDYLRRVEGFKNSAAKPPARSPRAAVRSSRHNPRNIVLIAASSLSALLFLSMIFYSYFSL